MWRNAFQMKSQLIRKSVRRKVVVWLQQIISPNCQLEICSYHARSRFRLRYDSCCYWDIWSSQTMSYYLISSEWIICRLAILLKCVYLRLLASCDVHKFASIISDALVYVFVAKLNEDFASNMREKVYLAEENCRLSK